MRITLKYKRGDTIYNIHNSKVRKTKFVSYLIYPETPVRIYYKCSASESWIEIENLYPTKEKALKAIEREETEK